jgi:hypothetical protein
MECWRRLAAECRGVQRGPMHRLVAAQLAKATRSGEVDHGLLCELMSTCYEEMERDRKRVDRANIRRIWLSPSSRPSHTSVSKRSADACCASINARPRCSRSSTATCCASTPMSAAPSSWMSPTVKRRLQTYWPRLSSRSKGISIRRAVGCPDRRHSACGESTLVRGYC